MIDKEYITIKEAMHCTGLSRKTLKEKFRGVVTAIGRNAWDRKEFFDFWKHEAQRKQEHSKEEALINSLGEIN